MAKSGRSRLSQLVKRVDHGVEYQRMDPSPQIHHIFHTEKLRTSRISFLRYARVTEETKSKAKTLRDVIFGWFK